MEIIRDQEQQRNRVMLGRMYFFMYNAKTKEVLPYWDRFPMVIPIMPHNDGFLGLNLHYIYPKDRLILLQQLSQALTGSLRDERTRLRLTYPILKAMHTAYRATPCIKRYLKGHIRSRFIEIPPTEWDIAAALPVQSFVAEQKKMQRNDAMEAHKARVAQIRKEQVWKDSKEKY